MTTLERTPREALTELEAAIAQQPDVQAGLSQTFVNGNRLILYVSDETTRAAVETMMQVTGAPEGSEVRVYVPDPSSTVPEENLEEGRGFQLS